LAYPLPQSVYVGCPAWAQLIFGGTGNSQLCLGKGRGDLMARMDQGAKSGPRQQFWAPTLSGSWAGKKGVREGNRVDD
jgi:hypothetical protein